MPNIVYNGEMDKRQGKNVTSKVIPELMEKDPKVVYLDADLMSCIGTLNYAKTSDRAIECGIAEANMIGVAAGLAAEGFMPICHSFGIFSSRRCFDSSACNSAACARRSSSRRVSSNRLCSAMLSASTSSSAAA